MQSKSFEKKLQLKKKRPGQSSRIIYGTIYNIQKTTTQEINGLPLTFN
jgi:hypothetical protein